MEYEIGQIFTEIYPDDAAGWCNENNCKIVEIEPENDIRRFQIVEIPEPTPEEYQEIINNLTMTPLDFIGVMVNLGLTLEQINEFLENNLEIKTQLTYCNSVYCGVVKQFLPITIEGIEITADMIETAFMYKNNLFLGVDSQVQGKEIPEEEQEVQEEEPEEVR